MENPIITFIKKHKLDYHQLSEKLAIGYASFKNKMEGKANKPFTFEQLTILHNHIQLLKMEAAAVPTPCISQHLDKLREDIKNKCNTIKEYHLKDTE